jgi:hypothetical protein
VKTCVEVAVMQVNLPVLIIEFLLPSIESRSHRYVSEAGSGVIVGVDDVHAQLFLPSCERAGVVW